jgi:hypothetical protein
VPKSARTTRTPDKCLHRQGRQATRLGGELPFWNINRLAHLLWQYCAKSLSHSKCVRGAALESIEEECAILTSFFVQAVR